MKKTLGWFALLLPFLIALIMNMTGAEFYWYFSDNYKAYDLVSDFLAFIIFCTGTVLLSSNPNRMKPILICLGFTFGIYQYIFNEYNPTHSIAKVDIKPDYYLHLVPHSSGAFTSSSYVSLDLYEKKQDIFYFKKKTIKTYDNIESGNLSLADDDHVSVKLITYSKNEQVEQLSINYIFNIVGH